MVTPQKIPQPVRGGAASNPHYVVIGAGAAGAAACAALRECGFDGRITLIGDEPHAPYDRTVLSKFVPSVRNDARRRAAASRAGLAGAARHRTNRREGRASRRAGAHDAFRNRRHAALSYDTALLATGSVPKLPAIPGCELGGVHVLRNLDDAERADRRARRRRPARSGGDSRQQLHRSGNGVRVAQTRHASHRDFARQSAVRKTVRRARGRR